MFWRKNKNEIEFISNFGPISHDPGPAAAFMPEWYKKQHMHSAKESKTHVFLKDTIRPSFTPTVKKCLPFRDMMTAGYIIPFPYDIAVKCIIDEDSGEPVVGLHTGVSSFAGKEPVAYHAKSQTSNHPYWQEKWAPDKAYKFINPWVIKTPPGVSCIFIHPQHQGINKWEVLSGVVDTDVYMTNVLFPTLLKVKPGDEFIIKGGTPMVQVIPFERKKWTHSVSHIMTKEQDIAFRKADSKIEGTIGRNRYKTWFWKRKEYK